MPSKFVMDVSNNPLVLLIYQAGSSLSPH